MKAFSRRSLIKGFGAAGVLAYPLLRQRRAEAAPIKRFITFFVSSGVRQDTYFPVGNPGTFASGSYNVDGQTLDALKPHLADIIITKGIQIYGGYGGDDHDNGAVSLLTGNKVRDYKTPPYALGESMDQYLARQLGTATPEPSLLLGTRLQRDKPSKWLAYDQTGNYKAYNDDPYAVYTRLFQGVLGNCAPSAPAATDAAKTLINLRRQSVLDSVLADSSALRRSFGLGANELTKLDRLETAVRGIEQRLQSNVTDTASVATCQAAKTEFGGTPVALTDANFPALTKMNIDLIALAVELDVTRIVTMMLDQGGLSGPAMSWLTYNGSPMTEAHHPISHGEQRGVSDYLTKLLSVDRWNFSQFGYLLDKLKAINEGGSTALDNSIAWFASDCSDGKAHTHNDMPFIIAGRAAGQLQTGRYVAFAGTPYHQRLLLTFANFMGQTSLTSWGLADYSAGGPLTF